MAGVLVTEDFTHPWKGGDITFTVEGKIIYANKMILSMWSPVFAAMFSDEFKEKTAKKIDLPGKKHRDVLLFMRYVHPPSMCAVSEDNCMPLLHLGTEYQVIKIRFECERYLLGKERNLGLWQLEEYLQLLLTADFYDLPDLRGACIARIACAKFVDLVKSINYKQLQSNTKVEILEEICRRVKDKVFN